MTRRLGLPLLLAALGALQTLALVHTAAWLLPIATAAALARAVQRAGPGRAALLGLGYGTGWLVAGTGWLYISMHRYGALPAPLAGGAVLLLSVALSLYLALAMAAFAFWRTRRWGPDVLLFAAVWLLAELARGLLFTGFPWGASGYTQIDGPLAALAPWVGVYGMGAVMALVAACLARALRPAPAAAGLLLLCLPALVGTVEFGAPTRTLSVSLLQTDVAQDEKFATDHMAEVMDWVSAGLRGARGDLVVAPETAVPLLPEQLDEAAPGYWQALLDHFAHAPTAALLGLPLGDFEHGYTNSVAGLSAAPPYRYDKLHLVPFGEFIPTGFRWFTEAMNIPLGDFDRGVANPPSFAVRGERVAPNICYEDLFGEELARRFVDPAQAPTLFANVSNLGWFDDSRALPQHLNISRLRTLEFQRAMVRATNTGATAVIDHRGRVTASLPWLTRGVLQARVEGRSGITPYAWWAARWSLWPLALLAVATVAAVRLRGRRGLAAA